LDPDFGPKNKDDEIGLKMAMYKTGEIPRKGYQEPSKTDWVNAQELCAKPT